jgi:hypothetical protein
VRRKSIYLRKGLAYYSLKVNYQKMKQLNKDRVLKQFIYNDNAYFDENGDIVIEDDECEDNVFFDVRASFENRVEYRMREDRETFGFKM